MTSAKLIGRAGSSPAVLLLSFLLAAVFWAGQASADGLTQEDECCMLAISYILTLYEYPGVGYPESYPMLCRNPTAVVSLYASADTYCTAHEYASGMGIVDSYCAEYDMTLMPREDVAANLTPEAIALLPVYEKGELNTTFNVTEPFMPGPKWYWNIQKTESAWTYEMRLHHYYSWAIYGFWGPLLLIGMAQKLVRVLLDQHRGYVYAADIEGGGPAGRGSSSRPVRAVPALFQPFVAVMAAFRKYLLTPSALPPFHQQRWLGCTVPTRWETLVVGAYWAVSIILGAINIHAMRNNAFFPLASTQIWRYVADRTGIMAYGNMPVLWMFAGRNNVFLWLTGWSFSTFNMYHRHVARVATLQAIVHSIGYTVLNVQSGRYLGDFVKFWWTAGVIATVLMGFVVLFSFYTIRRKLYESFLIIHIVLSALLLVFLYYHTTIFELAEYSHPYLLPPIVIWGFDRFVRLVRQVYCNLYVRRHRGGRLQRTQTTVTYDTRANMLTIDMMPGNRHLFPGPGQHYYLYQPFRLVGWENHPFSLAHWYREPSSPANKGGDNDGDLHLQFWVRPYSGWTKQLQKTCQAKGEVSHTMSVTTLAPSMFLEGPYGHAQPVHCFETILLVAGGTGIAGVLPYLTDYVRRTTAAASSSTAATTDTPRRIPTRTRHVTLVWSDRSPSLLRHTTDTVLAPLLAGRDDVHLELYVTGGGVGGSSGSHLCGAATSSSAAVTQVGTSSSDDDDQEQHSPISPVSTVMTSSHTDHELLSPVSTIVSPDEKRWSVAKAHKAHHHAHSHHLDFSLHNGRPDVLAIVDKLASNAKKGAASAKGSAPSSERLAVMVCGPDSLADRVRHVVAGHMETSRDSIEYFEEGYGW